MEKNKKILLADDVELFLEMERNFLQREDLDLLIAWKGRRIVLTLVDLGKLLLNLRNFIQTARQSVDTAFVQLING